MREGQSIESDLINLFIILLTRNLRNRCPCSPTPHFSHRKYQRQLQTFHRDCSPRPVYHNTKWWDSQDQEVFPCNRLVWLAWVSRG